MSNDYRLLLLMYTPVITMFASIAIFYFIFGFHPTIINMNGFLLFVGSGSIIGMVIFLFGLLHIDRNPKGIKS